MEDSAELVAAFLLQGDFMDKVEYSDKTEGFKIKLEMKKFPDDIGSAIRKCTREMVSTFAGEKSRVRFLNDKLLKLTTKKAILLLLETVKSWHEQYLRDVRENLDDYAEQFYAYANSFHNVGEELSDEVYESSKESAGTILNINIAFAKGGPSFSIAHALRSVSHACFPPRNDDLGGEGPPPSKYFWG